MWHKKSETEYTYKNLVILKIGYSQVWEWEILEEKGEKRDLFHISYADNLGAAKLAGLEFYEKEQKWKETRRNLKNT